jgi:predicted ATP-grasp superfamily ATP-dependent carboligase
MEFKYRQKDGGYYFIEMNTRLPWYNGIFADAGVNMAYLAYLDLAQEKAPAGEKESRSENANGEGLPSQRDRVTWVGYHNYASCRRETRSARSISLPKFISTVASAKSYAWWNRDDPRPFLASGMLAARRTAGTVLRKIGLR